VPRPAFDHDGLHLERKPWEEAVEPFEPPPQTRLGVALTAERVIACEDVVHIAGNSIQGHGIVAPAERIERTADKPPHDRVIHVRLERAPERWSAPRSPR